VSTQTRAQGGGRHSPAIVELDEQRIAPGADLEEGGVEARQQVPVRSDGQHLVGNGEESIQMPGKGLWPRALLHKRVEIRASNAP
jgi:hypothetical protein